MGLVGTSRMRVVGGEFRGRRIDAPRGLATRPTAGRVREAVFSTLGDLAQASVLDLFAGSGALGIEALSRGAARACFVDAAPAAIAAIFSNINRLGLTDRTIVRQADVTKGLPGAGYDLVFVDPPYAEAGALGPALSDLLGPVLGPGARVVTESDRRSPLELALPLTLERRYGDTLIRIYRAPET
jgi:16S rRNA (guanine966-N2)-methyltransferase